MKETLVELLEEFGDQNRVHQHLYSQMSEKQQKMAEPGLIVQAKLLDYFQSEINIVRQFKSIEDERKQA